MPFHRKLTTEKIAARDELYAMFAVTSPQIKAARNPDVPIGELAGRRRFKGRVNGATDERPENAG